MPRLLEVNTRTDALLEAACRLICTTGLRGLSLRAVAAQSRVSPAAIVHHLGGRARMDRVLGRTFGHRWVDEIWIRSRDRGLHAFLPADDEELMAVRVWQAWLELARADQDFAANLAGVRERQRGMLDSLAGGELDTTALDLLVAVVDGLQAAMCAPAGALTAERGGAALAAHLCFRSSAQGEGLAQTGELGCHARESRVGSES